MTVRVYRWTDTSAPQLSGTSGDLITLLDAVLVNGYGTQTQAGWTKAFTGTNAAAYRQGTGSNQFYMRVNDSGAALGGDESGGTPNAQEARLRGYEAMTALSTGTLPFPTVAQLANGVFLRKSGAASTVARPWIIIADSRTIYMFVLTGDTTSMYMAWAFGEFYSYKTSDNYRCAIFGRTSESSSAGSPEILDYINDQIGTTSTGQYIARDASGAAGSIGIAKHSMMAFRYFNTAGPIGDTGMTLSMRNPTDHYVYIVPVKLTHTAGGNTVRGHLRGFWNFGHGLNVVSDGDTFTGTGSLAGKTFMIIKRSGNNTGCYCMEISDTWDSN